MTENAYEDVSFDLNCTSQGGTVNQMLWLRNGEPIQNSSQFPILADAAIGLYYNTLTVHGRLNGIYTCEITNELDNNIMVKEYNVESKYLYVCVYI